MSPHYVHHKAGQHRRKERFIHHYVCTEYRKCGRDCDHANRVLAKSAEAWIFERVEDLVLSDGAVETALECARRNSFKDLTPSQEELARTRVALQATQGEINTLVATIASGTAVEAMTGFINERASELKMQRDQLRAQQRRLTLELTPIEDRFDADAFRHVLTIFNNLAEEAEPQELQRILRLLLEKVEWGSEGTHQVHYQSLLPTKKSASPANAGDAGLFDIRVHHGCPRDRNVEPVFLVWHH